MIQNFAVVLLVLTLSGCSWFTTKTEITTKPTERPTLTLPEVDVLTLKPVRWIIITPENYKEKFAELEKQGIPLAVFGLTGDGYTNLAINMAQLRKLIEQQQSIIEAYERYYIATEQTEEVPK